jgi:hypothetical protein
MKRSLALVVVGFVLAGCAGHGTTAPSQSGRPRSIPALKLAVLHAVGGRLRYCDPDLYPVAVGNPLERARQRLPAIESNRNVFRAILAYEHLAPGSRYSDKDLIAINDDYKQMQAIDLHQVSGGYSFSLLVPASGSASGTEAVSGTVSRSGTVVVTSRGPGKPIACPICLARGMRIATPHGPVPVTHVRVGMSVWSTRRDGRLIRAVVLETRRRRATGELLQIQLADGRSVLVSPGHPTAGGLLVGELSVGDRLSGSRISAITPVSYDGFTYDLLPSGPTGTYFADGMLLGSTLEPAA